MIFLAVNFHYIGDENKYPYGGIYPVSPSRFESQLIELGRYFNFVSQNDVIRAINTGDSLPEKSCLITLDDGLACQYDIALPILDKLGVPAVFFANAAPLLEHKVLIVHKIHLLRSIIPPGDFYNFIDDEMYKNFGYGVDYLLEGKNEFTKYRYDDVKTKNLKYVLNNLLSDSQKELIIGGMFDRFYSNEYEISKNMYLNEEMVIDLSSRHYLGMHTYSHRSLATLSDVELIKEIVRGKQDLESIVNSRINSISYPYGGAQDIDMRAIKICEKAGLQSGFTMERALNSSLDHPLCLSRLDTNDAPGGKSPAFSITDGKIRIIGNFLSERRNYDLYK